MDKVDNKEKIMSLKTGNAIITCKREDNKNNNETFNVVVQFIH